MPRSYRLVPVVLVAIATMLFVDLVDKPNTVVHAALEILATALAVGGALWLWVDHVGRALTTRS